MLSLFEAVKKQIPLNKFEEMTDLSLRGAGTGSRLETPAAPANEVKPCCRLGIR